MRIVIRSRQQIIVIVGGRTSKLRKRKRKAINLLAQTPPASRGFNETANKLTDAKDIVGVEVITVVQEAIRRERHHQDAKAHVGRTQTAQTVRVVGVVRKHRERAT